MLDRLRALSEELANPDLLARVVERLPDALVIINEAGEIIFFNARAELLFGYHRSEVLGETVEILMPGSFREAHMRHRKGFLKEPRGRAMGTGQTLTGKHKRGDEFGVEINLEPLQTPDGLFVSAVIRKRETPKPEAAPDVAVTEKP